MITLKSIHWLNNKKYINKLRIKYSAKDDIPIKIQYIGKMHKRSGKDAGFVERKCDCNLQQVCYNFHWLKTKRGGDIFEKNSNIFWNAFDHAFDMSDGCLGSR